MDQAYLYVHFIHLNSFYMMHIMPKTQTISSMQKEMQKSCRNLPLIPEFEILDPAFPVLIV